MKSYAIMVGVVLALVLGGAGIATGVVTSHRLVAQQQQATQQENQLRTQIASLRSTLAAVQSPKQTGLSAEIAHMGMCVGFDNSTGDINNIAPATVMAGVPSCPSGSFVSVVPQG